MSRPLSRYASSASQMATSSGDCRDKCKINLPVGVLLWRQQDAQSGAATQMHGIRMHGNIGRNPGIARPKLRNCTANSRRTHLVPKQSS